MIIGLNGKKRAGKDSLAQYLKINYSFQQIGFADAVKDAVTKMNPYILVGPDQWWRFKTYVEKVGMENAKELKEVRRLLQVMGTEVGRDILGQNCWIDIADKKRTQENVVFSDTRFQNEVDYIHSLGGTVVRIIRPEVEDSADSHASENFDFDADYEIINDGTLGDLYHAGKTLYSNLSVPA